MELENQELEGTDKEAYLFSKQAYKKADERENVGDYVYDRDLSNVDTAVYHNANTNQTHVSNRGSTSAYDWGVSDTQIALGLEGYGSRFNRAVDTTKQAHDKYGGKVRTSGHSLGGQVSNYTAQQLADNEWYEGSTGLNAGVSTLGKGNYFSSTRSACRGKNPPAYCSKTTNLYESGDPVSNRNTACDLMTFGLGGKMCRKSVGYGTEKFYNHSKKPSLLSRFAMIGSPSIRTAHNLTQHSLDNFVK